MSQYCLIDLSGLWWSAWFATEAVQECTRRVLGTIQRYSANAQGNLAVAVDRGSHRYALMGERGMDYKGDRPEKDRRAVEGLRRIEERLRALGWCVFAADGYEADDVLASLASRLFQHGFASGMEPDVEGYGATTHDITVVSADKDLRQLVGMATVESPLTGEVFVEREDVVKKHGVKPEQLSDWLALVGDKSDSIPGIAGVGDKTAARLLAKWGDLTGIALALSTGEELGVRITSTALQNLSDGIEQAQWIAQNITPLRDDLELDEALLERLITGAPAPLPKEEDMDEVTCPGCGAKHPEETSAIGSCCNDKCNGQWGTGCYHCHDPSMGAPASAPPDTAPAPPSAPAAEESQPRALVKAEPPPIDGELVPEGAYWANLEQKWRYAKMILQSRSYGARFGKAEDVMARIEAGREFGMQPFQALRSFHDVDGKPCISAQALMALCLKLPSCERFLVLWDETTNEVATVLTKRRGQPEQKVTFTIREAEEAGLTGKKNWRGYAKDMLTNRAIARAARFVFPEAAAGQYVPEDFGGYSGAA